MSPKNFSGILVGLNFCLTESPAHQPNMLKTSKISSKRFDRNVAVFIRCWHKQRIWKDTIFYKLSAPSSFIQSFRTILTFSMLALTICVSFHQNPLRSIHFPPSYLVFLHQSHLLSVSHRQACAIHTFPTIQERYATALPYPPTIS